MPASVTTPTSRPLAEHAEHVADPAELGVVVAHGEPLGLHAGVLEQQARASGVLAADSPTWASTSTARGDRSPRLPIGVATSQSVLTTPDRPRR